MFPHESTEPTAGIALEAHADKLRRRCEAVARFQGGHTSFIEEFGIFRSYAQEKGLYLASPPPELSRTPDDEGNERQVWFDRDSHTYLKATLGDFFGMLVVHRQDEDAKASPLEYLERLQLHNLLFGDVVKSLFPEEPGK